MNITEEKAKHKKEIEQISQQINQLDNTKNQLIAILLKHQGVMEFLEQVEKETNING
ncbi:MAG: hypothetical protein AABY22_28410 [Nanoarchaeota archaeon]